MTRGLHGLQAEGGWFLKAAWFAQRRILNKDDVARVGSRQTDRQSNLHQGVPSQPHWSDGGIFTREPIRGSRVQPLELDRLGVGRAVGSEQIHGTFFGDCIVILDAIPHLVVGTREDVVEVGGADQRSEPGLVGVDGLFDEPPL